MSRQGHNIYQRKDGRWEGRRCIGNKNGKTVYIYIYAASYEEALNKLAAASDGQKIPLRHGNSFSTLAEEWLKVQTPQLKPASISVYTNTLNKYLLPTFGNRDITKISRSDFTVFTAKLLEDGGAQGQALSPGTVKTVLSTAKSVFLYASREKGLQVADICGIPIKQPQVAPRIFDRSEQKTLEEWLINHLTSCNLGILLCLYTGMRVGEICALKWEDISRDEQTVYVHQSMQRVKVPGKNRTEVIISTPKSDCSERKIPLPLELAELVSANRKQDAAFLLTGLENCYIEPRSMQKRFKTVIRKCGLGNANFHALRHTFATRCVELGFDAKALSEILGHSTVSMTMNHYIHPTMEQKRKSMALLSGIFAVK